MKFIGNLQVLATATLVTVLTASGCASAKPTGPKACTLVGCQPGLSIDVRGDRGGDINVKIVAADGQMRSFDCDSDTATCSATFEDYTPENVSVTVTKKESNVIRSYSLKYNNVRPNGEDCPPVCKQAHIDLVL
jgi:hypothetical protein